MSEISSNSSCHSSNTDWYKDISVELNEEIRKGHADLENDLIQLGEIGEICFPFFSMGNVSSSNLFGLDELILFSFYFQNRKRYRRVLDLGANIGLHTLVLLKLGYSVVSYEPDPIHFKQLEKVLQSNNLSKAGIVEAAVSDSNGTKEFVRVHGNTTGSHLSGAKNDLPYGGHDVFNVQTRDVNEVLEGGFNLVKMDVEGHEATLISHINSENLFSTDFLLEVGSDENASEIYTKISQIGLNMYSQKNNWEKAKSKSDIPKSYKEGSLFISSSDVMDWTGQEMNFG